MKISRDDIKTFSVILVVCIICVIIAFILNIKSNMDKLKPVDEYNVFFSNVNYINDYIGYIGNKDNVGVYNLLDKKYIEKNNITYDNVFDKIKYYSSDSLLKATNMSYFQIGKNFVYYIEGKIYRNTYDEQILIDDNFSIIVMTDYNNLSFSLYPIDDNYKDIINNIKKFNIINNGYNNINKSDLITKEQVCAIYMSDFYNNIFNNIDSAYNYLSDDMKKMYVDVNSYKNYIINNYDMFSSTADKCSLNEINNKKVYTVIDSNGNSFVFTEESVMNYKVEFYLKEVND